MTVKPTFQTHGQFSKSPTLFFCDHACNAMPAEFDNLGLDERYLRTHIAYDIGSLDLTRRLVDAFETRLIWCTFSRLLVDPNRSHDREDLIPEISDGIDIPGNHDLSAMAREERIEHFFEPYHHALAAEIDKTRQHFEDPLIISIHSFTSSLHTDHVPRPWDIGVLWAHDEPTARTFMAGITKRSDLTIGDNAPYDARGFNYTIDRHVKPLGLKHLTLEVRQDLIAEPAGVTAMADLLKGAIDDLI